MYFVPALVILAKVVTVTVEKSVRSCTILYPFSDDFPNETTMPMLVRSFAFTQNAPLSSNDIVRDESDSKNCWLSL
jgi:hypothetical protein